MQNLRAFVKFVLFFIITFGSYSLWWIGAFFIPNRQYWREIIFQWWADAFVRISNIKIEIIGKPPERPFFLACNHLGYADIPVIRSIVEGVFVTKSELRDWVLGGKIIGDMGNIFINRQNRRDIPRASLDILNAINRNESVFIFPEGTSTNGETVFPFKSSFLEFAAKTDLPVYYAAISYQTKRHESPASYAVCWWDETSLPEHFWRFFSLTEIKATVIFGEEPVVNADRKELAKELWQAVSDKFIPII